LKLLDLLTKIFKNYQIFCGATEHVSILSGSDFTPISVDKNGLTKLDLLEEIFKNSQEKKIVSIMLANNETGVIQDIKKISQIAHQYGVLLHCDASQAFGKIKIDIN
jgi:cysteine desulfurase